MTHALTPLMPLRVLICVGLKLIPASGVAAALTPPVPICSGLGVVGVVVVTGATIVTLAVGALNRVREPSKEAPDHQRTLFSSSRVVIWLRYWSSRSIRPIIADLRGIAYIAAR